MRNAPLFLTILLTTLFACGPREQIVLITVQDLATGTVLDSARVNLLVQTASNSIVDTLSTKYSGSDGTVKFTYDILENRRYRVRATRKFYRPVVNENGDGYQNEAQLSFGDSSVHVLSLDRIEAPDPAILNKVREEVSLEEMLVKLKANQWNYAILPQLGWADVPALIAAAGDTTIITKYPKNPTSTYKPKNARVGLVALWLVEAIRKMEMTGATEDLQNLIPPSRAPILGTRQGNPSGHNTADQILRAQAAYQAWYEAVEAAPRSRRINEMRNIPLRNEGMSWM